MKKLYYKFLCWSRRQHKWKYSKPKDYNVVPPGITSREPVYYSYNSRRKCICCGRKEKLEYVHIYFLGGISQRAFSHWNEV